MSTVMELAGLNIPDWSNVSTSASFKYSEPGKLDIKHEKEEETV